MQKRSKIMSLEVTIPNATVADTVTPGNFTPDKDYKFIKAVRAFVGKPGTIQGGTFVKLSLIDSKGDIIQPSHSDGWIFSSAVAGDKRWIDELNVPIDGSIIKCRVENPTLSTAQYVIIFEFLLVDDLVKIANIN